MLYFLDFICVVQEMLTIGGVGARVYFCLIRSQTGLGSLRTLFAVALRMLKGWVGLARARGALNFLIWARWSCEKFNSQ